MAYCEEGGAEVLGNYYAKLANIDASNDRPKGNGFHAKCMEPIFQSRLVTTVNSLIDVDQLDRRLLDGKHKQAYFLWGHIKSRCIVGDELVISQSNYVKWCGGDGRAQMKALTTLIEFNAITVVQEGKNGPQIWQPAVYRREL